MTVERVRITPGGTDVHGDPVPSTEATTPIPGAFTAPRMSSDTDEVGRTGVVVGLNLFVPDGFDLTRADQVNVDGVPFLIDGEAGPLVEYENPFTTWRPGSVVALVRAEG